MKGALKILKYSGRAIGIFLELLIGFICFYFFLALWGIIIHFGTNSNEGDVHVYVRSNGVHTDICLPVKSSIINWSELIPLSDFSDTTKRDYIAIGWGDKGFFMDTPTWAELKASTALNAMFLPSSTAMHVEYLDTPTASSTIKSTFISHKQYKKLCAFVKGSFDKKNNRVQLIAGYGYWKTDNFYEAHGSYHMFRTCNVWTNDVLKAANIRTSLFSALPEGNMIHL